MFGELRGGTCILGRHYHLVESSEGGIFKVERAPDCGCGTQGQHSHLGTQFSGSESGFLGWEAQRAAFFQV